MLDIDFGTYPCEHCSRDLLEKLFKGCELASRRCWPDKSMPKLGRAACSSGLIRANEQMEANMPTPLPISSGVLTALSHLPHSQT